MIRSFPSTGWAQGQVQYMERVVEHTSLHYSLRLLSMLVESVKKKTMTKGHRRAAFASPLHPVLGLLPLGDLCSAVVVVLLARGADVLRPVICRLVRLKGREGKGEGGREAKAGRQ